MSQSQSSRTLGLKFLGPPLMERDNVAIRVDTRKAIALLAYLAVSGRAHSRQTLATLLWPDYEQARAHANLRRTLWTVRRAVGEDWLDVEHEMVSLRRGTGFWLDVEAFRGHLAECQSHDHGRDNVCPDCLPSLRAAVDLYRDDFLAGFTLRDSANFDEWQFFEAEGLRRELASALERLVHCYTRQGEYEPAIDHGRRWLALDPLHEPAHQQLMSLYAWASQHTAALRQYQECARILDEELGVPPNEETTRLYEAIRANRLPPFPEEATPSAQVSADPRSPRRPRHDLPSFPTPFVGREEELAQIAATLRDPNCRLLTLVGPGGVGKTRLALQAATEQLDVQPAPFPLGIYFVPLAPSCSADFLVHTIAETLHFPFWRREGDEPKRQLFNFLGEKWILLILDNFEHLVAGAGLLAELLQYTSGVKLLVTSRERLNLSGEWVLTIEGLQYPEELDTSAKAGEEYSAVQLFLQRAAQVDVAFSLTEKEMPALIRICRSIGGLPLGIELAAAWTRMLSCREIAHEIERQAGGIDFLTATARDVPDRHRSLRAVCDQSWKLLSEPERDAFRRLSVFCGGFQPDAAAAVAGIGLGLLSTLVDKSLLRRQPSGRYGIHEFLRQYAAERLDEVPPEKEETHDRHCSYFAAFLAQRTGHLRGAKQMEALDEISKEVENVQAAWQWAVSRAKFVEIGQAAGCLYRFYDMRSRFQEAEQVFGQAAAALRPPHPAHADEPEPVQQSADVVLGLALAFQGYFAHHLYLEEKAQDLLRESLMMLRAQTVSTDLALANLLAVHVGAVADATEAEQLTRQSLTIYQEAGDRSGTAHALLRLGQAVYLAHDDLDEAVRLLQQSTALNREIGNRWGAAFSLFQLGEIAQGQGSHQEAQRRYHESLELRRQIGDRWGMAVCLDHLGYLSREMAKYEQARQLYQESLIISQEIGDLAGIAGSLDNLGQVALEQGRLEEARERFEEGLALRRQVGSRQDMALSLRYLGELDLAAGDHEAAAG